MSNEKVWTECRGRGSVFGEHSPIRFGVDAYQAQCLDSYTDPTTECPICSLRSDMEENKSFVTRDVESLYTNLSASKDIIDKAGAAVETYSYRREAEMDVIQETSKELMEMLKWWKATCKIEEALQEPDVLEEVG